ncbi:hypothetical protein QZM35_17445 [Burkholderia sp. AU45274]|uniref:hypothetical protein n=1 Tax=Burkholderia sp. AU45274 TaxID=3059205 RepID=UPI00264DCDDB|nr:hypothetical protein [Burkholderia sp. AU45274]MDN7489495.1 hypothetical protein [Burkholderia sp. AU45274]
MNPVQLADQPTFSAFVMSCRLPRDPMFRQFVAYADGRLDCDEVSVQHATNYIHNACNLESRNELKTCREAERRFHHLLHAFRRWSDNQQHNERRAA